MPPAARITDMHVCPMVTGVVPHVGGPILPAGCPTVLIGMLPAARVGDMLTCVGPPDVIAKGSVTVLIGNMPAARMGDMTAHGGSIVIGFPTVMIGDSGSGGGGGGSAAPIADIKSSVAAKAKSDEEMMKEAVEKIKKSEFGKGEEGKKVVAKLEKLQKEGKLIFKDYGNSRTRGSYDPNADSILVNKQYAENPDAIESELVHEATHAVDRQENGQKGSNSIDEEIRTNSNQLEYYKEQRNEGFRDPELERRRKAEIAGLLREDIKKRYPSAPENRPVKK